MTKEIGKTWSIEAQRAWRSRLYATYRRHMDGIVDETGNWHGRERPQGYREKIWHCFAYLTAGDVEASYANMVLRSLEIPECHFAPFNVMQLLLKFSAIEEETRRTLVSYVRRSIAQQSDPRIQFAMYNPNFASMATAFLILAGELLDDRAAVERGAALLDDLRRVFMRCGTIMEYGSPTYTPITAMVMAELVNYAKDDEITALAAKCEERMWAEIVSHFHPSSGQLAGPYSRAYWIDSVGHCTLLHGFLHYAFGDCIAINPIADVFPPREKQVGHQGNSTLMWPNHVWLAGTDLHCPDYLAMILVDPHQEMESIYRTECIPCTTSGETVLPDGSEPLRYENPWEYAAWSGPNYTYLTTAYSLGTACSQFHDGGLSESFYLTYPLGERAERLEHSRVVLLRYLINDRRPEAENLYSVYGRADASGFRDEARKFGIQDRDCSMMVYKPKQYESRSISSMRLSVMIPCHYADVGEVCVGTTSVTTGVRDNVPVRLHRSRAVEPIYIRDGAIVAAFVPLATTDHGGGGTTVERIGDYLFLSFVNYQGPARPFSEEELFLTWAGLVAHVKSAREGWTIDRLRGHVASYRLSDRARSQLGGTIRWIRYGNGTRELEFAYSPRSEGIMVASVDGRRRPEPLFRCSAIPEGRLPFVNDRQSDS